MGKEIDFEELDFRFIEEWEKEQSFESSLFDLGFHILPIPVYADVEDFDHNLII